MQQLPESFRCYLVRKTGKEQIDAALDRRPLRELPTGELLIEVAYSSVNYKDAMAATGHPGIVRRFPHVPGIDAAGTVVESTSAAIGVGDQVVVTSYELGVERWGGWADYVRVPAAWACPLPPALDLQTSMTLGTAGLTAGLCVRALQQHAIAPAAGDVVVTGATGGVGTLAVMLLAQLGYSVVAVSGKADREPWLRHLGAADVIPREAIINEHKRPLLSTRFAGAVDTVGGDTLASLLTQIKNEGCVAACGVVGGSEVHATVYPFILRGVTLRGIDSAWCSMTRRREVWDLLADEWRVPSLDTVRDVIDPAALSTVVDQLLAGTHVGRSVVDWGRSGL